MLLNSVRTGATDSRRCGSSKAAGGRRRGAAVRRRIDSGTPPGDAAWPALTMRANRYCCVPSEVGLLSGKIHNTGQTTVMVVPPAWRLLRVTVR